MCLDLLLNQMVPVIFGAAAGSAALQEYLELLRLQLRLNPIASAPVVGPPAASVSGLVATPNEPNVSI